MHLLTSIFNISLKNLSTQLCKITVSDKLDYSKIRRDSKIRIELGPSFFSEIFSVPKNIVKQWTRSLSLVSVPGLYSDLDLENGKYEGGFKVWEGTSDLVKFLTRDQHIMKELFHRKKTLKILELGAGAGLASLAMLSRLISDQDFNSNYRIHLQDYNWQVLASLTLINFAVNLPENYLKALIETNCLRFFYGDWKSFRNKTDYKYDLIMMSEAIYNFDNYDPLHDLLNRHLKRNGYIVIATKDTYFGLSGGLYSWLDYVATRNTFTPCKVIKIPRTSIPRSILILRRMENLN